MSEFYTVAMFCACGRQIIEIDVPGSQIGSKIRAWHAWHQGTACGPVSTEEEIRRYSEWYARWAPKKTVEIKGGGRMHFEEKPEVVTICGSTRFKEEYVAENRRLTLEGKIVLTCGLFLNSGDQCTPEDEARIKHLHYKKIDLSDSIRVVNPGGYLGLSTTAEIEYAASHDKAISFTDGWHSYALYRDLICGKAKFLALGGELGAKVMEYRGWRWDGCESWLCPECVLPGMEDELAGSWKRGEG